MAQKEQIDSRHEEPQTREVERSQHPNPMPDSVKKTSRLERSDGRKEHF